MLSVISSNNSCLNAGMSVFLEGCKSYRDITNETLNVRARLPGLLNVLVFLK